MEENENTMSKDEAATSNTPPSRRASKQRPTRDRSEAGVEKRLRDLEAENTKLQKRIDDIEYDIEEVYKRLDNGTGESKKEQYILVSDLRRFLSGVEKRKSEPTE